MQYREKHLTIWETHSEKSIKTKRHAAALGELIVLLSVSSSVVNFLNSSILNPGISLVILPIHDHFVVTKTF